MKELNQKRGGIIINYIMLALNVVIKFLYTPILLSELGQSEYGLYSLVITIVGYVSILDFGFGSAIIRYTVKYKTQNDRSGLMRLYGTATVLYLIIGLAALIVCGVISLTAGVFFGNAMTIIEVHKIKIMVLLCGLNLLFCFPLQIASSVLIAYEKFVYKNLLSLLRVVLEPLVMIIMLYAIHIKSIGVVVVVITFNLVLYLAYYLYTRYRLDFKLSFKGFDRQFVGTLFTFSMSMFLLTVYEQIQFHSGQFVLGAFCGSSAVAVWGLSMLFVYNYRLLSTTITNVYSPSYIEMATNGTEEQRIQSLTERMVTIQFFVVFGVIANYIVFGKPFITIWAGEGYDEVYHISLIMMLPMALGLPLDFCYLWQIAHADLSSRIKVFFASFIVSFAVIASFMGITLLSFAIIVALSYFLGQVVFIVF